MIKLKEIYQRASKQTQNRLQEIFDSINFGFNDLYNVAENRSKKRMNTYIEEWKGEGLLTDYFGMLAKSVYARRRVKNSEILELLICGAFIEEQSKLKEVELKIFKEVANYYYKQGQEEVKQILNKKREVSAIPDAIFLDLFDLPNSKGYIWKQYLEAVIKYNADQIYRQCVVNIGQNKDNRIEDDIFQCLINKQQNAKLCVNGDKISGDVDLTLIGLNNRAKIQGISSFDDKARCRFVSMEDEATTKECESLDGQEFYIHDWNEFYRYSKTNDSIVKYRCYGLVAGLNLPPINDGFHWCRSIIEYMPIKLNNKAKTIVTDENFLQEFNINEIIRKNITNQKEKLIRNSFKNEIIRDIALNNDIKKIYIHGNKSYHKANKIYLNSNWANKNSKSKERTIRHEVGHAIDYKYDYISTKGELLTALEIDKKELLKKPLKIKNALQSKEYEKYAELSDIISGLTNNKIKGKFYHSNTYWKRDNALEKETFADLFSIAGSNDVEYLEVINKYLPNTLRTFDGLIRRMK